jgi:hypothetical protein
MDELFNSLIKEYPGIFENLSKFEIFEDTIQVYDPVDYMWSIRWLWYLEKIQANLAWDITKGDPSIKIAVIDRRPDITHPDLAGEILYPYDPFTMEPFTCMSGHGNNHGTTVAGFASAETTEQGQSAQGQLASVGFNTKILSYITTSSIQTNLQKALHASAVMGADVIVSCAGLGSLSCSPVNGIYENLIVNEIIANGTVIVMPAGNGVSGHMCGNVNNFTPFYPFHPSYNKDIIIVSSTDINDMHQSFDSNGIEQTHSHFLEVDICAPGYNMMGAKQTDCNPNGWPYFGSYGGTSFSSPIVAGTAALIKSINRDFTPAEVKYLITSTADPIVDSQNYPGLLGSGRLNAYKAVQMAYESAPIEVNSNQVWTEDKTILFGLEITNGSHLTITSTVYLSKNAKISIHPGAKLTINGGKLTSLDNYPWKGIYVEGNRNLSQTFANQGALILQNGAVIENAHDAVMLRSQQTNWGHNGGIVQATNATFRNNWRDVEFNSYPLTSISFFQDCTFETTPQILHQLTNSHVSMWDVQGVNFTNCTFTDTRPNIDYYSYRKSRNGIYGHDAAFVVDNCNFNAMKYGIYAISPDAVRTFKVYDSDFSGFLGVYFSGMDNAHVVNNTFFVKPGYMYSGPGQETYGLYVENSQNFEITGNILTSSGSQAPSFNSFGVIARNTGTIHQEIYRNDFTGFSNAIQAIGNNRSTGGEGLEIRCNRFYNNHSLDILIKTDPALNPLVPQGIRELQGQRGLFVMNHFLAGNIFGSNTFFTNHGLPIYYLHHNPGSHQNLLPNHFSRKITFVEPYSYNYNYSTSCPVKQISRSTQQLLTEMEGGIQGQRETETRLAEMTDGGNTQLMLQQVQLTNSFTAYDTYKHLMNTSPWLSQEVLASVASTTDGLNHAMIRDILVANPQSAKSDQVIKALENRKDPLPAYMLAQIEAGKEKWGEMELLQQQVIGYKTAYDRALNEMVRNHMHEGDNKSLEAVDNLLAGIEDIRYQYWLAELAYSRGEHKKGAQLLQTIGKEIDNKDEYETYNHQMYIDYYALLNKWTDEEKYPGFTGLPQEALDELKRFVNTGHRVSGKALAILLLNDAIQYQEPIYYPEEEMVKKSAPAIPSIPAVASPEASESFLFRLFPNPGRDYITLEWCMEQEHATGSRIEIFSAAGVPVQSIAIDEPCNQAVFSLENLQGGNYVARLVSGHKIKNISFVISR